MQGKQDYLELMKAYLGVMFSKAGADALDLS
jgi:hypothetical protein